MLCSQTVLIRTAIGGVRFAAIPVTKPTDAEIFVTVGNEEKIRFVMENHGIAPDGIFSSRDELFKDEILKATDRLGVDLVLNSF
ncbi:hypothetical protein P153DRAFT_148758 [Dothidotthia symphoricarpi CBS 119687]|uniref:NmrA-like domain-containing protein n=1 Tax=Dothidotthia symphoricarpi CBS 119687 TaxID=1392245 RepID=A0A6A5ZVM1_9PLEO|nr:uncharacterized protein P153DRAFT_148758 [Dothidotthia symphoricarpi CBS 119687]KAF2123640.1 hypothetical protein P153DRAFT_148758 [Dothidotthia symphoricarpi CBS 119687]